MTEKLSLKKLNNQLQKAFDILDEGKIKPDGFKEIIFGIFFLKRYSDLFNEERKALRLKYAKFSQDILKTELENPVKYTVFIPKNARWDILQHENRQIASKLKSAVREIQLGNEVLGDFLGDIDFNKKVGKSKITDHKYKEILNVFNNLDLSNENLETKYLVGNAFESLIKIFADGSGKKGGDYFTSRSIVKLLVKILDPQPNMSIYDPTSGTAGMLIHSNLYLHKEVDEPKLELFGQEKLGENYILGRLNLLMHDILYTKMELGDTLENPLHLEDDQLKQFDIAIANPKFSTSYSKSKLTFTDRFNMGYPAEKNKADLLFLLHMIYSTKEKGKIGIILPHGVLFRGGSEAEIRKKLIETKWIHSIIGLPLNCFYGSSIPACIIVVTKSIENDNILFVDASKEYGEEEKKNYLRPQDIDKISYIIKNSLSVPRYSREVKLDEIKENDFILNISRYIDNASPEELESISNHLFGFVPIKELDIKLCDKLNFNSEKILTKMKNNLELQFVNGDKNSISKLIKKLNLTDPLKKNIQKSIKIWYERMIKLCILEPKKSLSRIHFDKQIIKFVKLIKKLNILDFYTLRGIYVKWWENAQNIVQIILDNGLIYFDSDEVKAKEIVAKRFMDPLNYEIKLELQNLETQLIHHFEYLYDKYYKSLADLRKDKIKADQDMFNNLNEIGFSIPNDF